MKLGVESFTMFKDFFEDFHGAIKQKSWNYPHFLG